MAFLEMEVFTNVVTLLDLTAVRRLPSPDENFTLHNYSSRSDPPFRPKHRNRKVIGVSTSSVFSVKFVSRTPRRVLVLQSTEPIMSFCS
jgi:hypothetical protein